MARTLTTPVPTQVRLADSIRSRLPNPPRVQPLADPELQATFLRAAAAWSRWKERDLWEQHS
jgi:hypothetical protein